MTDPDLTLFDLQVLDATLKVGRAGGTSQEVVRELGLRMTARNIARVLVAQQKLEQLALEVRRAQTVVVLADGTGKPQRLLLTVTES